MNWIDDEDPLLDTQGDEEHEIDRDEYDDGGANELGDEEHSNEDQKVDNNEQS